MEKSQRWTRLDAEGNPVTDPSQAHVAVRDNLLGLEWSVAYAADARVTQKKAEKAAAAVRLFGHKDWRLPTLDQLESIRDITQFNPAVDLALFPGTKPAWHWTASPWAESPEDYAWGLSFYDGLAYCNDRGGSGWARAVRSVSAAGQ